MHGTLHACTHARVCMGRHLGMLLRTRLPAHTPMPHHTAACSAAPPPPRTTRTVVHAHTLAHTPRHAFRRGTLAYRHASVHASTRTRTQARTRTHAHAHTDASARAGTGADTAELGAACGSAAPTTVAKSWFIHSAPRTAELYCEPAADKALGDALHSTVAAP